MKYIMDKHFSQENPNKYRVSSKLKTRCKKLRVHLYWSQWYSKTLNGIKERRFIWKPPEFLEVECERREKVYAK